MSHTTTINNAPILDENAIISAIKELVKQGLDLKIERNTEMTYYMGRKETCDIVVKTPGNAYDFGFRKVVKDGRTEFELRADLYGGSVEKLLKPSVVPQSCSRQQAAVGRFMQQYSRFATENAARRQGYNVQRSFIDDKTGNIQLELVSR